MQIRLLSELLRKLIPGDVPIVVTLGNHEFWGRTFEETLAELKKQTIADKNIFYLDLIGAVELGGMNFVGGTLFFDGSMRIRENQRVDEWDGWQDWRIGEIVMRYMEFNAYYVDMIKSKMKPGISTVLCTHHVPHLLLNGHDPSHYSFYTGVKVLMHELPFAPKFDHCLVCGYTHRRMCGEIIPGFMGINVGSDYERLEMMEMIRLFSLPHRRAGASVLCRGTLSPPPQGRRTVFRKRGGPNFCVPDHRTSRRMPLSVPTCRRCRAGTGGLSQAST